MYGIIIMELSIDQREVVFSRGGRSKKRRIGEEWTARGWLARSNASSYVKCNAVEYKWWGKLRGEDEYRSRKKGPKDFGKRRGEIWKDSIVGTRLIVRLIVSRHVPPWIERTLSPPPPVRETHPPESFPGDVKLARETGEVWRFRW